MRDIIGILFCVGCTYHRSWPRVSTECPCANSEAIAVYYGLKYTLQASAVSAPNTDNGSDRMETASATARSADSLGKWK